MIPLQCKVYRLVVCNRGMSLFYLHFESFLCVTEWPVHSAKYWQKQICFLKNFIFLELYFQI